LPVLANGKRAFYALPLLSSSPDGACSSVLA